MSGGRSGRLLLIITSIVVAAAVLAGLFVLGSPQDERRRRLDQTRVTDLMALRSAIETHYRREGVLPDSLGELARRSPLPIRMTDPAGGRLYAYEAIDSTRFRLCAEFDFATPADEMRPRVPEWAHGAGRQCFSLVVRKSSDDVPGQESRPLLEGSPDSAR
jgi:hypothetical protein